MTAYRSDMEERYDFLRMKVFMGRERRHPIVTVSKFRKDAQWEAIHEEIRGGNLLRTHAAPIQAGRPHGPCGVKYGDGLTLIDSELGTVFFDPATGRMATLQQLIDNPGLAELTGYGLSELYRGRKLEEFMVREDGDLLR